MHGCVRFAPCSVCVCVCSMCTVNERCVRCRCGVADAVKVQCKRSLRACAGMRMVPSRPDITKDSP